MSTSSTDGDALTVHVDVDDSRHHHREQQQDEAVVVKFEEVSAAAFKIRGSVERTPCIVSLGRVMRRTRHILARKSQIPLR